jgi:hypothetical protein
MLRVDSERVVPPASATCDTPSQKYVLASPARPWSHTTARVILAARALSIALPELCSGSEAKTGRKTDWADDELSAEGRDTARGRTCVSERRKRGARP